ncbi:MAG TPA: SUF system Fe-S cluster assembly protein [Paraburkholderia sp.]|nr:SUF system Fe-S cluster assembly protein [Paraburkholderia sp.]
MSESGRWKQAQAHDDADDDGLKGRIIEALRTVYDPEIPVNIYDLGLVYGLDVDEHAGRIEIRMTLTAPSCPVAQTFPATVEDAVLEVSGVNDVHVELVWDPPWSRDRMSEAARLQLGML